MRSLIVGMGIGSLYKDVLTRLGHKIVTVDLTPGKADFASVSDALQSNSWFDTAHVCTPNFTHLQIAEQISAHSKIVFIEKPGVKDVKEWNELVTRRPFTRFMMVKNNMWRDNISELQTLASKAKRVNIEWTRLNCIPSPGNWFTNKELAFGGVSRDLMPHLLSLYVAMNPMWRTDSALSRREQLWELKDIESTDYGTVNSSGVYNVDDKCTISFSDKWRLLANWRSMDYEKSAVEFLMEDDSVERFELGWCPEDAYSCMIKDAVINVDDADFWKRQNEIDTWIHERIENL